MKRNSILLARSLAGCLLVASLVSLPWQTRAGQVLAGRPPAPLRTAGLRPIAPLDGTHQLRLAIGLPLRHADSLRDLLVQIYDPASPLYRHYLTPQEFAGRFGPTEPDYQALIAFAQAHRLQVANRYSNRLLLDVTGSVADIEAAFHVKMSLYPHPSEKRSFYAPDTVPSIDLAVPVLSVSGLDNYSLPRPRIANAITLNQQSPPSRPRLGSGPSGTYLGSDFRQAYVPGVSLAGKGQTVGLLEFDGFYDKDITTYEKLAGLSKVHLNTVSLDGFNGTPSPYGGDLEVALDIEVAISMAPGLSKVLVYEAGPYGNWHDILNRMATDNQAKQLSCSWYAPGAGPDPMADQIFQQMAAQGQSFFDASGDACAYTGLISFPGDNPYITQVGGTTLNTTGPGGAYVSETVWNWGGGTGSGGGISTSYPIPTWQLGVNEIACHGSTSWRNVPDVALTADNVFVEADNGVQYDVGGTSCAAPLWAAFTALVNQQAEAAGKPDVGFINPAVYALGVNSGSAFAFRDIVTGDNTGGSSPTEYSAAPGYDLCTGWGSPNGQELITALAGTDNLAITGATGFSASGPVGGPFGVTTQDLSLQNQGSAALTWQAASDAPWLSVSPVDGTLAPGGPAQSVTVNLNSAASSLQAGEYTSNVWFTNTSTAFVEARRFSLTITNPNTTVPTLYSEAQILGLTNGINGDQTCPLVLGRDGRLYGTTVSGGAYGFGTVFSLNLDGSGYSLLHSFDDPNAGAAPWPNNALLQGADGKLYGTTAGGGIGDYGTVFSLNTDGTGFTVLYNFTATGVVGAYPSGGLIQGRDGVLYGTTSGGGNYGYGTIFKINTNGTGFATIRNFFGGDGAGPTSLMLGLDGLLYGTTSGWYGYPFNAATYGNGTVFRMTTNGTYYSLHRFLFTGVSAGGPIGALAQGSDGTLYGATFYGGTSSNGMVFKMNPDGTGFSVIHSFAGCGILDPLTGDLGDGSEPWAGVVLASDGMLYGTTQFGGYNGVGTVYRLNTDGTDYTTLYSFTGGRDGSNPLCSPVQGGDGAFYGVTVFGGPLGVGSVFRLAAVSPSRFTRIAPLPDGTVQIAFSGYPYMVWRVQVATNLSPPVAWMDLTSVSSTNGVFQFSDPGAANFASRYYRAMWP